MEKECTKYLASKKIEFCITLVKDSVSIYETFKRSKNYNKKLPNKKWEYYNWAVSVGGAVIKVKREFNIIEEK